MPFSQHYYPASQYLEVEFKIPPTVTGGYKKIKLAWSTQYNSRTFERYPAGESSGVLVNVKGPETVDVNALMARGAVFFFAFIAIYLPGSTIKSATS